MLDGHVVFSPITHSHPIAMQCELPGDWEWWERIDRVFIEWADELWVFQLDGWQESEGVQAEIRIAKELGKVVRFVQMKYEDFLELK